MPRSNETECVESNSVSRWRTRVQKDFFAKFIVARSVTQPTITIMPVNCSAHCGCMYSRPRRVASSTTTMHLKTTACDSGIKRQASNFLNCAETKKIGNAHCTHYSAMVYLFFLVLILFQQISVPVQEGMVPSFSNYPP